MADERTARTYLGFISFNKSSVTSKIIKMCTLVWGRTNIHFFRMHRPCSCSSSTTKIESVLCFVGVQKYITNFLKKSDIYRAWMLKQTWLVLNFDNFDMGFIDICSQLYQFELLEFYVYLKVHTNRGCTRTS